MQRISVDMFQMQHDVVFVRPHAPTFIDFDCHCPADDITTGEILGGWGKTLHEPLTLGVCQITTLTTRAFGNQHTRAINAGGVKLDKLHILQWQPRTQGHRVTISGTGVRRGA